MSTKGLTARENLLFGVLTPDHRLFSSEISYWLNYSHICSLFVSLDIYNVLTLRTDIPDEFKDESLSGVVRRLQEWAKSSPLGKAEPEKYASVKRENNLI